MSGRLTPGVAGRTGSVDCPGESDTHQRFKSVVVSKPRHRLGRFLDEMGVGDRVADVAATFTTDLGDLRGLLLVR